jgi:hypothetical protein
LEGNFHGENGCENLEDLVKVIKASLALTLAEKLPKPLADKLIVESLKILDFKFSKEDLEALEEWFKPREPVAVPAKPLYVVSCPLCGKSLNVQEKMASQSERLKLLKEHAKECEAIYVLREALKSEGG